MGTVIDIVTREKLATAPANGVYECGQVTCTSCGFVGAMGQLAGSVRSEVPCPVCRHMVSFEPYGAVDTDDGAAQRTG